MDDYEKININNSDNDLSYNPSSSPTKSLNLKFIDDTNVNTDEIKEGKNKSIFTPIGSSPFAKIEEPSAIIEKDSSSSSLTSEFKDDSEGTFNNSPFVVPEIKNNPESSPFVKVGDSSATVERDSSSSSLTSEFKDDSEGTFNNSPFVVPKPATSEKSDSSPFAKLSENRKESKNSSSTSPFAPAGNAYGNNETTSSVFEKVEPNKTPEYVIPTEAFASGLPDWSLEPPNLIVRKRRGSL